jgi:putative transposase
MAPLCREFDISRKTGYKIFQRYKGCGLEGLTDRSRRPYRQANQLPFQIEKLIVQLKREHSSWGAPKIREKLRRLHSEMRIPAISTVHAVLYRHGLVNRGRRRRFKAQGTTLSRPLRPNELWCADYKGEFMLGDPSGTRASTRLRPNEIFRAYGASGASGGGTALSETDGGTEK